MASHETTAGGRRKMSAFGQAEKRNRDGIEEDEDWVENQTKRRKSRHREKFETVSFIYPSSLASPDDNFDL